MTVDLTDAHCDQFGVGPICEILQVIPTWGGRWSRDRAAALGEGAQFQRSTPLNPSHR
jgi:hypothetical protein